MDAKCDLSISVQVAFADVSHFMVLPSLLDFHLDIDSCVCAPLYIRVV